MHVSSFARRCAMIVTSLSIVLTSVVSTPTASTVRAAVVPAAPVTAGLFRTTVTLRHATDRARLDKLGVRVLSEQAGKAIVLADDAQLETLARLRFEPQASDELGALVNAQGKAWLTQSLQPMLQQASTLQANVRSTASADVTTAARASLRAAVGSLSVEQAAAIASSVGVDSDGDGLTDTQEGWWCTDPMQINSNLLGTLNDGQKVQQTKDWIGNLRSGPPEQRPYAGWPMMPSDGHFNLNCVDGDHDGVPDFAERWELGLNPNAESTTGDKFDDGQKLWGITPPNWGGRPRPQDATVIGNEMPNWVGFPGKHPMVAAYPSLVVTIVPTFTVQLVTTVTTEQNHSENESRSYSASTTEGTTTGNANTRTWNEWEEVSEAVERKILPASSASSNEDNPLPAVPQQLINSKVPRKVSSGEVAVRKTDHVNEWAVAPQDCSELDLELSIGPKDIALGGSLTVKPNSVWSEARCRAYLVENGMISDTVPPDYSGVLSTGFDGVSRAITESGEMMSSRLYEIGNILKAPVKTNTTTKAKGTGGATTNTHEQYEDHTVTDGQQWGTTQGWSNATAVDSAHTADFWFSYRIRNTGTDYAMAVDELAFNIYIGDDPLPICTYYVGTDSCGTPPTGGGALFTNLKPGNDVLLTAHKIPLTLEQAKAIDLGGRIRVILERLKYGIDELFYENARAGAVLVAIEDGTDDGDESVDNYLIPTWGDADTMHDVISRYFPGEYDADGNYIAIWTPELRQDTPTPPWCVEPKRTSPFQLWCKHALSTAEWWNAYFAGLDEGTAQLKDTRALPNSLSFFRFYRDTDLDGYADLVERRLGTNPSDPASRPQSLLIAGVTHQTAVNSVVTSTLSLLNTGIQDAIAVEATMIAPDNSITVLERSVGGSGRVRGQKGVVVGGKAKLLSPLPGQWEQTQHAKPVVSGYYAGAGNRVYTFTVACSTNCQIGSGSLQLGWIDSAGVTGSISYGSGYASPTPMNVGASGVQLGMLTGAVTNGEFFTMTATAPTDVFSFRVNREPYTPPIVIVQYSNPEGKHRVVTPIELTSPMQDLSTYSSSLLPEIGIQIVTTQTFHTGTNTTPLVINNTSGKTISDAHLYMQFVNISGTVVSQIPLTFTVPPGPFIVDVPWNTANFTEIFNPNKPYIVMAFLTDYQGYTIDKTGRVLSTYQDDPRSMSAIASNVWDFGSTLAGEVLQKRVGIASTGFYDLRLSPVNTIGAGLSATLVGTSVISPTYYREIEMTLDTQGLPAGPYAGSASVRTNDVAHPTIVISVTGTIQNPGAGPALLSNNPSRPWNERVYVPGGAVANTIVTYTSQLVPAQTTPLYLLSNAGSVIGRGLHVLQVPTATTLRNASVSPEQKTTTGDTSPQSPRTPQQPSAYEIAVDDGDAGFSSSGGVNWNVATSNWSKPCTGYGGDARWTKTRIYPNTNDVDWARWTPNIPEAGWYEVYAFWPGVQNGMSDTESARYKIHSASGDATATVSQAYNWCSWIYLGTYQFSTGQGGYVHLGDYTGGESPQHAITVDAIRFVLRIPDTPDLYGIGNSDYDENFTVDWSDATGAAEGYVLQEWNGSSWYDIAYPSSSYQNISNHAYGDYCYRVIAHNASGYGNWSGTQCISVRPAQATPVLSAISNADYDGNYTVQWASIPWTTQYYLQEKLNSGSYTEVYRGTANSWSATNRGVGLWCYRAQAQNMRNTSGWSNEQCALVDTPPNNPVNLQPADGQARLGRQLPLTWQDGGDPDNAPQSYRTYQAELKNQSSTWQTTLPLSTTVSWNPVVPDDGIYTWRVQANDGALASSWTNYSKLTAYSVGRTSPSQVAFALPQAIGAGTRFEVQHGLPFAISSPGVAMTLYITVPRRIYTSATLDAIITTSISSASAFQLDIGVNGIDWSTVIPVGGGVLHSPDLGSALNAYLAASGVAPGNPVKIPVAVSALTQTDGFITNLYLNAGIDSDPLVQPNGISFSKSTPEESDLVTVTAQIGNNGYTATNVLVSFFVGDPKNKGTFIGSDFISQVAYNASVPARVQWFTAGLTGTQRIYASIDVAGQITELSKLNNTLSTTLTILSRSDLRPIALALSDDEPVVGELVTATLQVSNTGQTNAGAYTVALYQGNPYTGGYMVGASSQAGLLAGAGTKISFTWVPTHTGEMRLYARVDKDRQVNESDRSNNDMWSDVYVGMHGPILMDSGAPTEAIYSSTLGYGYLDVGQPDQTDSCGTQPHETLRRDPGGRIVYRFDHLQPGRFYHLDVTYFECDGAGRQQYIDVDGNQITALEDLSDGAVHRLSLRLDPALYADRTISVTVVAPGIDGAIVNEVNLHDVDYRYADAGGAADRQYPGVTGGRVSAYGWLSDTTSASNTSWGSLPYQSVRISQGTNNNIVRYRFDGLSSAKQYQVQMTLWQPSGTARIHSVQIDGIDTGLSVNSGDYILHQPVINVPSSAYASDGSIVVNIVRTNASTGAFVNEIALEERTIGVVTVPAPVAGFSATPLTGTAPLQVQFTDQSSGAVTSRLWAFGDGTTDTATNPTHTYNANGYYTVTLTVTGAGGDNSLTRGNYITVYQAVSANFTAAPTSGTAPLTATFTNQSTGNYSSLLWNFGDGTSSATSNPSHTYAAIGVYTVTLTAYGLGGTGVLTKSNYITVTSVNQVIAAFTASPLTGMLPLTVTFTNQSTGPYTSLVWKFGDGTSSTLSNPSHTYAAAGVYTVSLTASGVSGNSVITKSGYIAVQSPNDTIVWVSPSVQSAQLNTPITVSVQVANVSNFGAFEFALSFNPSLIEVQAVSLGEFLGSTGRTIFPIGPAISNTAGTASFGAASLGIPLGPDGGGRLAYVRVKPKTAGSAALHFTSGQLSTVSGSSIPFSMQDGVINVSQCQGDVDDDGDVDIIDVQLIAYRWGKKPPDPLYETRFDLDGDGDIDIIDIQMVAYRWGTTCNAGAGTIKSGPLDASIATFGTRLPEGLLVPNKVFTASVVISDVVNLGSFEFTLGYSSTVVEVLGVTLGAFPGSTGRTIFPLTPVISPTAGTLTFGAATLGATPLGPYGDGVLAEVQMRALTISQSSLVFLNGQVSDIAGAPQTVALEDTPLYIVPRRYLYLPMAMKN